MNCRVNLYPSYSLKSSHTEEYLGRKIIDYILEIPQEKNDLMDFSTATEYF